MDFSNTIRSKLLPALAAFALFFVVSAAYFAPQFRGEALPQHDVIQYEGMAKDISRDGRRPAVDGRHVRRHAGLPDQRGLSGPAGEADRRTGGEDHRHARRIPVFRHGLDVAHAADRRDQPVGGHRRGAGLRAFDLLPADHRRGARHENVGAGLRSADDERRVDDPAG